MKILVDKQLYRPGSVVKGIVLLDYISRPYNAKYIRLNATGISKVRLAPSPLQVHIKHLHIAHFIPFTTRGLRIPNTIVPSGSTLPIDVQYSIKVSMFASSTAKNATVMIPITIGSQTAPVYPEEDSTVAVNSSFPSTTSLNPSLYLPTSSTYPATSRSPHLSPSTLPTYLPTSVNPSQRLSMPSINPAWTSTSYEETSSIGINSPPASPRPTTSSFSEMHLPNTHSHVTGSLPHLGGNTGAWQTTSANNNSETEMLPPSYDQLFPI